MQIYHYHPVTGLLLQEGIADESPLEPGVFLIPAYSTNLKPPPAQDGKLIIFNGELWQEVVPPEVVEPPPPSISELAAAKLEAIQAEKIRVRDGGVLVDGVLFDTDKPAMDAYTRTMVFLYSQNAAATIPAWKASCGVWVEMTLALLESIVPVAAANETAVFVWQEARELEVAAAVAADSIEALQAVSQTYQPE